MSDAADDEALRAGEHRRRRRAGPADLGIGTLNAEGDLRVDRELRPTGDRPSGRGRPGAVAVCERIANRHRLAVAVNRAVLAPHPVRDARIPGRIARIGAGDADRSAGHARDVERHARVKREAPLVDRARRAIDSRRADVMRNRRDLRRSPSLVHAQSADNVGNAQAALRRRTEVARVGAAVGNDQTSSITAQGVQRGAFQRNRRREAAAERSGVGQHVGLVVALAVGREEVRPGKTAAREREEGVDLTSGQAGPSDVSAVETAVRTTRAGVVEAGAVVELIFDVSDQWAVGRVGDRIEGQIAAGGEAEGITAECRGDALRADVRAAIGVATDEVAGLQIAAFDLAGDVTGNAEAGVGAGKHEADDGRARDGDRADADVFSGDRALAGRQIGSLSGRNGDDAGGRSQK